MADDKPAKDAEDGTDDDIEDDADQEDSPAKGGRFGALLKGKGLIIAIVALVVVLGGGGTALVLLLGGHEEEAAVLALPGPSAYVDLPEMLADLRTGRCRSPVLKLTVTVELEEALSPRLKETELQMVDGIRALLRDRERGDLMGKEGTEKLRYDVRTVIDKVLAPDSVRGIYFKDLLLQ
ncbi:MAG: flagellar basal body-associated FliL family protein [Rhodobacterales bacterium]|nr:flagellar basal body-associated FliL family protein [Rhodobacterales bacterium]